MESMAKIQRKLEHTPGSAVAAAGAGGADTRDKFHEGMIGMEVLQAHNHYRSRHGAPPLTLDESLSIKAQHWADELWRQNRLVNSPAAHKFGENIFHAHGNTIVAPKKCVKSWYSESNKYNWDKIGHQKGTSHFTQLIWKGSEKLGVGYSTGVSGSYLVCNYDPPGNKSGEYEANVFPPLPGTKGSSVPKPVT